MKRTRTILAVLGVAVVLALGYLAWRLGPEYFGSAPAPGSIEFLRREAAALNRSLPAKLDDKTELMEAEAAPSMLIYRYRLVEVAAVPVDSQRFSAGAKPLLIKTACERPETRDEFLKYGVTLRYSYFDKDKQHIATLDVKPADCGF
jgi:hypothetical protein